MTEGAFPYDILDLFSIISHISGRMCLDFRMAFKTPLTILAGLARLHAHCSVCTARLISIRLRLRREENINIGPPPRNPPFFSPYLSAWALRVSVRIRPRS